MIHLWYLSILFSLTTYLTLNSMTYIAQVPTESLKHFYLTLNHLKQFDGLWYGITLLSNLQGVYKDRGSIEDNYKKEYESFIDKELAKLFDNPRYDKAYSFTSNSVYWAMTKLYYENRVNKQDPINDLAEVPLPVTLEIPYRNDLELTLLQLSIYKLQEYYPHSNIDKIASFRDVDNIDFVFGDLINSFNVSLRQSLVSYDK